MLISSYRGFLIAEKVRVKNDAIHNYLMSSISLIEQAPIFDYVMHNKNLLTIKDIEYNSKLLLPANFSFAECAGCLYYGQFTKSFLPIYVTNSTDFWE